MVIDAMPGVTILGGGIAGLTAAINLKYAGIDVEVHERKAYCGKHTRDFQFLENWTVEHDALEILYDLNIRPDFYAKPCHTLEILSPSLKRCLKTSSRPFMYLVKRGPQEGSIDRALQSQAVDVGIPVVRNSKLDADEADIIATGKQVPSFIATGILFPIHLPDKILVLFDDNLSRRIYSYFVVNNNVGQIVSINPADSREHRSRIEDAVKRFEEIMGFKVTQIKHRFAAPACLYFSDKATTNQQYFIGEAAGFQDCLAGFGMMYAVKSGYLAAKSIADDDDYECLWQTELLKPMRVSRTNRLLFEKLSDSGYEKLVNLLNSRNRFVLKLLGGDDLRDMLHKLYNHSLSYFLWPLIYCQSLTPLYRFLFNLVSGRRR
jgi:flavin-dependent dehydrogenase